ncbi:MAG: cobalamin-binding protein [Chloroflexi bacterium]|nr:cobalamin-binding protein [Chloroflexota bacterium]
MPKIVSLIPSATEIVCVLGFESDLVGRSHECDYPPTVRDLPALTAPKFDPEGSSRAVDARVQDLLQAALSVYRVDEALLTELQPDVIVTQAQCEICAVSLADVEQAVAACLTTPAQIVSLEPMTFADVLADVQRVATALGVPERGEAEALRLQKRVDDIATRADHVPAYPTVATIEWIDPLMAAGNWVPELIGKAGGINLFGAAGQHSPWMTWDDVWAADPDRIIVMPCGYDIETARANMAALTVLPGWESLRAVREGHVYLTDGNAYFNRPGPRLSESLEILAEILHPEAFHFEHEGSGWVRF